MINNKIGVYNLNNPFTKNITKEEQDRNKNKGIRERIMMTFTEMIPKIKEESSKIVLSKVKPIMNKNWEMINSIKNDSLNYQSELEYLIQNSSNSNLTELLMETDSYVKEIRKNVIGQNNFLESYNKQKLESLDKEKEKFETFELIDSVNILLKNVNSEIEENNINFIKQISELRVFIIEAIKRISESFKLKLNNLQMEDQLLLEGLKGSLKKLDQIGVFLKEVENNSNNLIQTGEEVQISQISNETNILNRPKNIIDSIPCFFSSMKNKSNK